MTKKAVAKTKSLSFEDLYESLEREDVQHEVIRLEKHKSRELVAQDVYQGKQVKQDSE